jgi:hypothetical protein
MRSKLIVKVFASRFASRATSNCGLFYSFDIQRLANRADRAPFYFDSPRRADMNKAIPAGARPEARTRLSIVTRAWRQSDYPTWRLVFVLAVLVAAFFPQAEAATPASPTVTMCANQPIPAGYVVTALSTTKACGGGLAAWNTMTLRAYAGLSSFTACAPLPNIPAGYLITALSTTTACRGGQGALVPWNTMTLTAYQNLKSIKVCAPLQNVPDGFIVTAAAKAAWCHGTR